MAKDSSSQKLIGKNNAPRVQIEYDVELYGSQKKVELPFVTGVMADLSGVRKTPLSPLEERKFLTFDQDNFNDRMRAIKPSVQFRVENTLSDEDELLNIDLDFESMNDFSPGEIAQRIPEMTKLLEARAQLTELITYMDGKASAEDVVKTLLEQPDFLQQFTRGAATADPSMVDQCDEQQSDKGAE
jgi:type VI secretion system protein ImpB